MPIGRKNYAAYTTAQTFIDLLRKFRSHGSPEPITIDTLQEIYGMSESSATRTHQALRYLGLVGDDMFGTVALQALTSADNEYKYILGNIVQNSYSEIFDRISLDRCSESDIEAAFRDYEPSAQQRRMARLFIALCRESGILPEDSSTQPRKSVRRNTPNLPALTQQPDLLLGMENPAINTNYQIIKDILDQLPETGTWTESRRKRWLNAIEAGVDLLVEITPDVCNCKRGTGADNSEPVPLLTN